MAKTSEWDPVREMMKGVESVSLGKRFSDWFYNNPVALLNYITYYKFSAKMIGQEKRILHLNCREGLGTYLLDTESGINQPLEKSDSRSTYAEVRSKEELSMILQNAFDKKIDFFHKDSLLEKEPFDVIIQLEGTQTIDTSNIQYLKETGLVILGIGDFAEAPRGVMQKAEFLENKMKEFFHFSFVFSAQNELIRSGFIPYSNYFFFIGSKKR